jgi:DNA repair protein RecO (recombination protein O)
VVRGGAAHASLTTRALLVRRIAYGESDLIVTLLTEQAGKLSALARGARRSQRRFGGALEPMHTLRVALDERTTSDLYILREASIDQARSGLTSSLEALEAAGRALKWLAQACVAKTPEPLAWSAISDFLDALDASVAGHRPRRELAEFGLRLLSALGWALDFEQCVRCGKRCEPGQAAFVDAARGGLVCRACGGARQRLDGALRARLAGLMLAGGSTLLDSDVDAVLALVESALRAHVGEA